MPNVSTSNTTRDVLLEIQRAAKKGATSEFERDKINKMRQGKGKGERRDRVDRRSKSF